MDWKTVAAEIASAGLTDRVTSYAIEIVDPSGARVATLVQAFGQVLIAPEGERSEPIHSPLELRAALRRLSPQLDLEILCEGVKP